MRALPKSTGRVASSNINCLTWETAAEEHVENLLRRHITLKPVTGIVFVKALTSAATAGLMLHMLRPVKIVLLPLLRIRQDSESVANGFEGFVGSRGLVLVRMELQGQFPVRLLELRVGGGLGDVQNFVVIVTLPNPSNCFQLLLSILAAIGRLTSFLWLRLAATSGALPRGRMLVVATVLLATVFLIARLRLQNVEEVCPNERILVQILDQRGLSYLGLAWTETA